MQQCWREDPETRGTFEGLQQALLDLLPSLSDAPIIKDHNASAAGAQSDGDSQPVRARATLLILQIRRSSGEISAENGDNVEGMSYLSDADKKPDQSTLYVDEVVNG